MDPIISLSMSITAIMAGITAIHSMVMEARLRRIEIAQETKRKFIELFSNPQEAKLKD